MWRKGSPWHHGKWNSPAHAILQRVPVGKCIPCSVFWVRPWVSSWPSKPPKGARIGAQATPAATLVFCFFSNRELVLAGVFKKINKIFFFFSWCLNDAYHLRRHSPAISTLKARGCLSHIQTHTNTQTQASAIHLPQRPPASLQAK